MANLGAIERRLKEFGIEYSIIDLGGEIYRVEDVVKAGVNPAEVVKTLLVRSIVKRGLEFKTEFNALAIRGGDRLDFKKVRRIFGPKTDLAKVDEVKEVVGVPVGAVCPIAINEPVYFDEAKTAEENQTATRLRVGVYFDHAVMKLRNVNLGSGDLTCGLDMTLADLLKAVGEFQEADLV
ncbi:hypothetical protein A2870_02375 [Candidatus Curtissbacteria bacterium RIFCSPHIGHO2_01_FULL_41_11]|uniref:YbaK/aminoacyl-tRNA synthetase-associated domain-containing protein n=1 Tax=Candidatus Curtissbacteria bacterium RIFCSPHIGHO2_01_FULL_41_11 TaxID=1797711 RepID=A0A1F5G5U9_9BACT|nr:MAG: hypothetical protein A2870_02375 [Candidatus Curtissbacteria bacterium RIFCSPHIGHO2_01_FULL_41_11]